MTRLAIISAAAALMGATLASAAEPIALPSLPVQAGVADGHCEVIVYSQDATGSLKQLQTRPQ